MSGNLRGAGSVGNASFGLEVNIKPLQQGLAAAEQLARTSSTNIQTALADLGGAQATSRASTQAVNEISATEVRAATEAASARRAQAQAERELAQAQQESARAVQGVTSGLLGGGSGNNALGGLLGTALTGAEFGAGLAALNELSRGFHEAVQGAIDFNGELQGDAIRLETFTGSVASATQKLAELQQQATSVASGGFSFADLEQGDEILLRFGQDNERVRQMVADTAAGSGKSYQYIAQYIGELYDRLDNGLPVARTVLTLERLGIVTGDYARQLDEAAKAGASQAEINDLVTASLARYQGKAQEAGNTLPAVFQETRQEFVNLAADLGKPVFDTLLSGMKALRDEITTVDQAVREHDWGKAFKALALGASEAVTQAEIELLALPEFLTKLDQIMQDKTHGLFKFFEPGAAGVDSGLPALRAQLEAQLKETQNQLAELAGNLPPALTDPAPYTAAGAGAGNAYYKGLIASLSEPDLTALNDITSQVTEYLKNQVDDQGQPLDITPQIKLDLTEVISQQGDFQQAAERLKQELGTEEYNAVLQLSSAYQQLATDTVVVNYAQGSLADTTKALAAVQDQAKQATTDADNAVKAAQATAQQHAQAVQDAVQTVRDEVDALDRDQRQVDAGLQSTLDGLTRQQKALQDASKERQQEYQAELKDQQAVLQGLNDQLKADRDAATQHAEAFKAVEQGTLDIFYQENDTLDATTQKIIARYQAEIDGAERAKEATQDKAGNLEADQRRQLLALDEQIQTARENNDTGRLAALEAERKAYLEKSQPQIDLERERAAVAADDYNARVKGVQQAADKQAAADKQQENADQRAVDAQTTKIKNIQDAQQAQQAADQQALDNLNQQIQGVQDEKKARDQAFSDRKQQLSDEQSDIERNGRAQAAIDKQHVADTQQAADNVKAYWATQIANAQENQTIAQNTLKAAQDKEKADNDDLKHIQDIIKAQDEFYTKYPTLLPHGTNIDPGATTGPGGDHPTPGDWTPPAPAAPTTPFGPGPTAAARPLFQPASTVQASAASRPIQVDIHNPTIADVVGLHQVTQLVTDGVRKGLDDQAVADRAMFQDIVRGGAPAGQLIG